MPTQQDIGTGIGSGDGYGKNQLDTANLELTGDQASLNPSSMNRHRLRS